MTNKPKVTVTPDDGDGFNSIFVRVDGDGGACQRGNVRSSFWSEAENRCLYHAIERIAELEAERDVLKEQSQMLYADKQELKEERDRLRKQNAALAAHVAWMIKGIKQRVDIGLQFALCHQHHEHTREAVKIEQEALRTLLEDTPATSLARRDAKTKLKALEDVDQAIATSCGFEKMPMSLCRAIGVLRNEYLKAAQEPEITP